MSNHLQSITPLNIETIRAWVFVGNHHSDSAAFKSIETFHANAADALRQAASRMEVDGCPDYAVEDGQ
jgi:hypothetical protein